MRLAGRRRSLPQTDSASTPRRAKAAAAAAPAGIPRLDRVIHERLRLAIVSALAANEALSFRELKELLQATDGNVSVHARRLEEAGYVSCTKSFEGRVPKTVFRLTAEGRRAFEKYLSHLEALVRSAKSGKSPSRG